jgi:hypothetical protein
MLPHQPEIDSDPKLSGNGRKTGGNIPARIGQQGQKQPRHVEVGTRRNDCAAAPDIPDAKMRHRHYTRGQARIDRREDRRSAW